MVAKQRVDHASTVVVPFPIVTLRAGSNSPHRTHVEVSVWVPVKQKVADQVDRAEGHSNGEKTATTSRQGPARFATDSFVLFVMLMCGVQDARQ